MENDNENASKEESKSVPREFPSVLEFSLERKSITIRMQDPRTDRMMEYKLQELDGHERDKYLNVLGQRMKVGRDGAPAGIKDFKDLQADLVSRSLLDSEGNNVPVAIIQRWPVSVQAALFKQAQLLSSLEDSSEKEAKND